MKSKNYSRTVLLLFLLLALASPFFSGDAVNAAEPGYAFTTIDYPGATQTYACGIAGNKIVGYYHDAAYHGFLYDGVNYTSIDVPGAVATRAYGISNNRIVGTYTDSSGAEGSFLYDETGFFTFMYPGAGDTKAYGIWGEKIVGVYDEYLNGQPGRKHGFLYDGTNFTSFDYPGPDVDGTELRGISGDRIVGIATIFEWSWPYSQAFTYKAGNFTTLNIPSDANVLTYGISEGNIVGSYSDSTGQAGALLYNARGHTVFNYPGAMHTAAYGISANRIVGYYSNGDNIAHGFLATLPQSPAPGPATLLLLR